MAEDQQDSDVTFQEEDVLADQVGKKSAADLEQADAFAHEYIQDVIAKSTRSAMNGFEHFRSYAMQQASKHGAHDQFAKAGKLVGDLVVVATKQMLQSVPVVGVLLKHGIMAGLDAINGQEKFDVAAQQLIATMSSAFDGDAASTLVDAHRTETRNAWLSAKDPSQKRASVKAALSGVGIAMPAADAAARIYQQLVETANVEAWIQSCRSGANGKTAECATDGAIPEIKKDAEQEAHKSFQEDDGKKQGQAR